MSRLMDEIKKLQQAQETAGAMANFLDAIKVLIEEEYQVRLSPEQMAASLTLPEMVKAIFQGTPDPCMTWEELSEECRKYYFHNNRVVAEAIIDIAELEEKYQHRCMFTRSAVESLKSQPLTKKAIELIVETIHQHVKEAKHS